MKRMSSVLLAMVMMLAMVLTACNSSSETKGSGDSSEGGSSGSKSGDLEIFSWWTAGGEADGLKALMNQFNNKYPDIEVTNAAVAGGAGSNAKAVLATRMQGGDPPSTFQVHGGAELMTWVDSSKMANLNDMYEENGWNDIFPKELIDLLSKDGDIYGVPVDIHRGNVFFYNKKIFEDNNIKEPKTYEDFFKAAEKLKSKGITPLALGDKNVWPATMLFENALLANLGPDQYRQLWNGDVPFDDPAVKKSAETVKKMLGYVNKGHSSLAWQDAAQMVVDGKAAMTVMGDWAKGFFTSKDLEPKKDFGWFTSPGTDDMFMVINDSFGLPKGVENPDNVKKFLKVLASKESQVKFNQLKGSIPARTDIDHSKFDVYAQETMDDFSSASLTPSLAHGSAAPEGFATKANQAVNIFVTQKNVDQLIQSLQQASSQLK
ncbi:ABC transporter substrate-binding protein [Tuberibacillus sp. Marseille-P3662]|uniref:ABC transporter substrate-binding protein n=1 Tax=Tuberibacillus sp. Marseille-P3662 TaxID=1965358 RepID=UPI000A1CDFDF|nr:ABC transporter substrate-binding protein [Tuberibacillus sp. Marseille-P3662]